MAKEFEDMEIIISCEDKKTTGKILGIIAGLQIPDLSIRMVQKGSVPAPYRPLMR